MVERLDINKGDVIEVIHEGRHKYLVVSTVQWDWQDDTYAIEGHDHDDENQPVYAKWVKRENIRVLTYENLRSKLDSFVPDATILTVDAMFKDTPAGDFRWSDDVGSDRIPWACDDEECGAGWHMGDYYTDIGREDGKRFIEVLWDSHADGDAQPDLYWEEGDDPREVLEHISGFTNEYFKQWAEYWLDCYHTERDPLNDLISGVVTKARCLASADYYIRYLFLMKGKE